MSTEHEQIARLERMATNIGYALVDLSYLPHGELRRDLKNELEATRQKVTQYADELRDAL